MARIHSPTTSPGRSTSMNPAPLPHPWWTRANSSSGAGSGSHSTVYRSNSRELTRLYCTGHTTPPAGFGTRSQPDCVRARRETQSSVVRHGQCARTKASSASLSRRANSSSSSVGRNMHASYQEEEDSNVPTIPRRGVGVDVRTSVWTRSGMAHLDGRRPSPGRARRSSRRHCAPATAPLHVGPGPRGRRGT